MDRHVHLPEKWLVRLEDPEDVWITSEIVQHQLDRAHDKSCVRFDANDGNEDRQEALADARLRTRRQRRLLFRPPQELLLLILRLAPLLQGLCHRSYLVQELRIVHSCPAFFYE